MSGVEKNITINTLNFILTIATPARVTNTTLATGLLELSENVGQKIIII